MTTESLDDVLAGLDVSVQDGEAQEQETEQQAEGAEQEALEGEQQEETGEQEQGEQRGGDPQAALHAERNRVRRKYTDTVADFERKLTEANTGFEKKLADALSANDQKWEQRFNQFSNLIPKPQEPEKVERPDLFENPDGFMEHGVRQAVDPIKSEIGQLREFYSQRDAIRSHGADKVKAAFTALDQAAKAGDPDAVAAVARVKQSMDPYGDIVAWHQQKTVINEVGSDPQAFIQKKLDEALNDPAFLAKALEKAKGGKPSAQGAETPTLPSLNRVTSAADNDDEEGDAGEVFNTALRSGVRR